MKIKFFFFMLFAVGMAWGQTTITIDLNSSGITATGYNSGAERTWTQNGVDFGGKAVMKAANTGTIQFQASNGVIYNTSAIPGVIKTIKVTQNSGNAFTLYGGSSTRLVNSTAADYTVGGTSEGTTSDTTWTSADLETKGYTFFAIKKGSGASYVSSIEITYVTAALSAPDLSNETFSGTVGSPFSETPTNTGGTVTNWSIVSGSLPTGLSLNSSTGEISGTPTTDGTFNANIKAENSIGDDTATYTFNISAAPAGACFSEDFSDITNGDSTSTGGSSTNWTGNANFPTVNVNKAYQAGGAVRLGTSSAIGSIQSKVLNSVSGDITVKVWVKGWTNIEGDLKVSIDGQSETKEYTAKMADSFEEVIYTFNNVASGSKLKIETTVKRAFIDEVEIICGDSDPAPKIEVNQGGGQITNGTGDFDYGNQLVGTSSSPVSFTIKNTGDDDLTIGTIALSGTNSTEFSIDTSGMSSTVAPNSSTNFTVTFSPSSHGSKTATVTIPNNDNTNFTFTVKGNGTYSANSDIVTNTGFTYTNNIAYVNYQTANITNTSNSLGVFQFKVRDGGGSNDGDNKSTTLTDIGFSYSGSPNTIRSAALFNGNSFIKTGTVTASGISFTGLNITASDNGESDNITLRVSFTETVTDRDKLVFTITSATADASGSVFGTANAGGAFSDNGNNNRNKIQVTADRLFFVQQPTTTAVNLPMNPAVTVSGSDVFGNRDIDFTGQVQITSDGTMTGDPVGVNAVNGLATFSGLVHTVTGSNLQLLAGYSSWTTVLSNYFDINTTTYSDKDYRTTGSGNWVANNATPAIWERYDSATNTWSASNSPSFSTSNNVYIEAGNTLTTGGSFGNSVNIHVKGTFNVNHNSTAANVQVYENGILNIGDVFKITGNFIIDNDGTVNYKGGPNNQGANGMWAGTEKFAANSNFFVSYADRKNPLFDSNSVSTNPETGALFGNLIIQPTVFKDAGNWTGIFPKQSFQLTKGDFIVNNSTDRNFTLNGNDFTVGGDMIINISGTKDVATRSDIGAQIITVNGDVVKNGAGAGMFRLNGSGDFTLNVEGNIKVNNGLFRLGSSSNGSTYTNVNLKKDLYVSVNGKLDGNNTALLSNLNFNGSTTQNIDIANQTTAQKISFNIKPNAYVKLINQNFALGTSSEMNIENGGILDFGFNGSVALNLVRVATGASTYESGQKFSVANGGTIKITSPDGITSGGNYTGNVQVGTAVNRNFGDEAIYHYIGKTNQVTGDGLAAAASAKIVIVELENSTSSFWATPTNTVKRFSSPGRLEIRNGIVKDGSDTGTVGANYGRFADEIDNNPPSSQMGSLTMTGGRYILYNSAYAMPHLSGNYNITGGVVEFANNSSTSRQNIRGGNNHIYQEIEVTGSNVGNSNTNILLHNMGGFSVLENAVFEINQRSIKCEIDNGCAVLVDNGAIFKTGNSKGFNGFAPLGIGNDDSAIHANIQDSDILLGTTSIVEYISNGTQIVSKFTPGYENLKISGSAPVIQDGTSILVNNIASVTPTGKLTVQSTDDDETPNVLVASKGIQVATGGQAIFENNAQLMQDTDAVNSGDIDVYREVIFSGERKQYNFVTSPVADNSRYIKPNFYFDGTNYYSSPSVQAYNEATYYFDEVNGKYIQAKGYAVKEPATGIPEGLFTGVASNGNISYTLQKSATGGGYNLVGNPYPSNLDIKELYTSNSTKIEPDFYFWDNRGNGIDNQQGSTYENNQYAIYNAINDTGVSAQLLTGITGREPDRYVKVGTGFMVQAKSTANGKSLDFKNEFRVADHNDIGYFGKPAGQATETDRYWLTLTTPSDVVVMNAVVYFEGGNNGFSKDDSESFGPSDDIYTIADNKKLSIQGKAPFVKTDVVPLGVKLYNPGYHYISLHKAEGIFAEGTKVYLKDKLLHKTWDLTKEPYRFISKSGEFTNRFEIVYLVNAFSTNTDLLTKTGIDLTKSGNNILITANTDRLSKVEILDLNGQPVYYNDNINNQQLSIPMSSFAPQLLVIRAQTDSGESLIQKWVNK